MAQTKRKDLIIYQKYINLMEYADNLLCKFPRSEKPRKVAQVDNSMVAALRFILYANKMYGRTRDRLDLLNRLDAELQLQRVLVRASHKRRFISNKNYMEWSRRLDEIGRILGGWIKATVGKNV